MYAINIKPSATIESRTLGTLKFATEARNVADFFIWHWLHFSWKMNSIY